MLQCVIKLNFLLWPFVLLFSNFCYATKKKKIIFSRHFMVSWLVELYKSKRYTDTRMSSQHEIYLIFVCFLFILEKNKEGKKSRKKNNKTLKKKNENINNKSIATKKLKIKQTIFFLSEEIFFFNRTRIKPFRMTNAVKQMLIYMRG